MKVKIQFPGALHRFSNHYQFEKQKLWVHALEEILGDKFSQIILNDRLHNYVLVYLNHNKIQTFDNLFIHDEDSLVILTAISGG